MRKLLVLTTAVLALLIGGIAFALPSHVVDKNRPVFRALKKFPFSISLLKESPKFLYPHPPRLAHNSLTALSGTLVRTGCQGRAAAPGWRHDGCAAGHFHPRPGPGYGLPRLKRGSRFFWARTPAGRGSRAMYKN